jgi:predicted lipid carrier protein YhbT
VRAPLFLERYRPETTKRRTSSSRPGQGGGRTGPEMDNDDESEAMMATAEECRRALQRLTARISEMNPADRATHLADRTLSCKVSDLGVTFLTRLGSHGADDVREVTAADETAQIRFTANSDDVVAIAGDPGTFARAWLTGRLKVEGNLFDLLRLRKLMS